MDYLLLINFNIKPLHVSSRLAAHHQEDQLCININFVVLTGCCSSQSTQRMTVPIAVYTELILLMMSGKPARNMYRLVIEIN